MSAARWPHPRTAEPVPRLRLVPPRAPRSGVPIVAVQLAAIFAGLAVLPLVKVVDNDFWWHLRTGQIIVTSGIPRHDPFSWSRAGAPWTTHEWLSEAIIYVTESMFGYVGNVLLFSGATVAALWLMYALGRRMGAGTRPLVALTLLAACVFGLFVTVRPQVFTWLLFAAYVHLICRDEDTRGREIWAIPALMALWVNLHLGFFYGFLALGCWVAANVIRRLLGEPASIWRPAAVAGASLLATFANPSGPAILWYPVRYFTDASVTKQYVQEWQRPHITDPFHAAIFIVAGVLLLAVASRTRPKPFLLLLALATAALSMQAVRNAPFAALVVVPVAGSAMAARWRAATAEADSGLRTPVPVACAIVLLTVAIVGPVSMSVGGAFSFWSPATHNYPVAPTAYVAEHDAGKRVLNDYSNGGFEIAQWYPSTKVFVDGRTDFYGDQFLKDYIRMLSVGDGWQAIFDRYAPQVVMLPPATPLVKKLRAEPAWRVVYEDAEWVVLERR